MGGTVHFQNKQTTYLLMQLTTVERQYEEIYVEYEKAKEYYKDVERRITDASESYLKEKREWDSLRTIDANTIASLKEQLEREKKRKDDTELKLTSAAYEEERLRAEVEKLKHSHENLISERDQAIKDLSSATDTFEQRLATATVDARKEVQATKEELAMERARARRIEGEYAEKDKELREQLDSRQKRLDALEKALKEKEAAVEVMRARLEKEQETIAKERLEAARLLEEARENMKRGHEVVEKDIEKGDSSPVEALQDRRRAVRSGGQKHAIEVRTSATARDEEDGGAMEAGRPTYRARGSARTSTKAVQMAPKDVEEVDGSTREPKKRRTRSVVSPDAVSQDTTTTSVARSEGVFTRSQTRVRQNRAAIVSGPALDRVEESENEGEDAFFDAEEGLAEPFSLDESKVEEHVVEKEPKGRKTTGGTTRKSTKSARASSTRVAATRQGKKPEKATATKGKRASKPSKDATDVIVGVEEEETEKPTAKQNKRTRAKSAATSKQPKVEDGTKSTVNRRSARIARSSAKS